MDTSSGPKEYGYSADQSALLHRRFLPLVLAALPACAAFVAIAAFAAMPKPGPEPRWLPLTSFAVMFSWLAFWMVWTRIAWAHARRGRLGVDRHGVFLDDTLVVPADQIASAAVATLSGTRHVVRLRVRGQRLTRYLEGGDPQRVVAALGLDGAHARSSYVLPWRRFRSNALLTYYLLQWLVIPVALVLGLLASARHGEMDAAGIAVALTFGLATSVAYWALWARSRLHVTFGTDGIWMKQWGRQRIVRWADVASIDAWKGRAVRGMRMASDGFDLVLRDGARVPFFTVRERMRLGLYAGDIVATRLREAMAAFHTGVGEHVALPPRGDLTSGEWIKNLRRAASGSSASFRTAAMDVEQLWRAVEDPAGAPLERAAAAAALGARDDGARDRLRVAAAAVASPKLRIAFEAAAETDDHQLADALDQLDAPCCSDEAHVAADDE